MNGLASSRYNVEVRLADGQSLLHNTASGALVLLNRPEVEWFRTVSNGEALRDDATTGVRVMSYAGFFVPTDRDELGHLEREYWLTRSSPDRLVLSIAPTLACNFGCDYCYQGHNKPKSKMNCEVQEGILNLVRSLLPSLKHLHIAWYGGEPTLALDVIAALSDGIIERALSAGVAYDAMIVTNGFGLDPEVARALVAHKVVMAQVTLDGAAVYHDQRRALLSGKGTFHRILDNLAGVLDETPLRISVRVNIDARNKGGIYDLLAVLAGRGFGRRKNFGVYFAPVEAMTEGCRSVSELTMGKSEYACLEGELHRHAFDLGLAQIPFPTRFRGICGAIRPLGFVVTPEGDLHKCWDTVSWPRMRVGNVLHDTPEQANERAAAWLTWSPFDDSRCRRCKLLPACAGACAHKFLNPNQTAGEAASLPCPSWKYQMRERLVELAIRSGVIRRSKYNQAWSATDDAQRTLDYPESLAPDALSSAVL